MKSNIDNNNNNINKYNNILTLLKICVISLFVASTLSAVIFSLLYNRLESDETLSNQNSNHHRTINDFHSFTNQRICNQIATRYLAFLEFEHFNMGNSGNEDNKNANNNNINNNNNNNNNVIIDKNNNIINNINNNVIIAKNNNNVIIDKNKNIINNNNNNNNNVINDNNNNNNNNVIIDKNNNIINNNNINNNIIIDKNNNNNININSGNSIRHTYCVLQLLTSVLLIYAFTYFNRFLTDLQHYFESKQSGNTIIRDEIKNCGYCGGCSSCRCCRCCHGESCCCCSSCFNCCCGFGCSSASEFDSRKNTKNIEKLNYEGFEYKHFSSDNMINLISSDLNGHKNVNNYKINSTQPPSQNSFLLTPLHHIPTSSPPSPSSPPSLHPIAPSPSYLTPTSLASSSAFSSPLLSSSSSALSSPLPSPAHFLAAPLPSMESLYVEMCFRENNIIEEI
ncbi:hypothetical protein HELRODRAFT_165750 [Helobdella robusta]|uniref:Uncharacterized protein n=1 Tax=Helobdella robusta TaxID=6412 RepID=T1EX90_HELRO|nr:hypothetical protein HELRODRAFT_165750 [Helobdella robusta]ESN91691.1 hypothetical protein HELRODRAFT_165750 [Helobdella robusta]